MKKQTIKNKIIKLILCQFIILSLPLIIADVYVGTSEGYIFNTEDGIVSDATVRATVSSCVVGCSQETKSESTGYYVIANLNLPKNERLTVYAEKQTPLGLEFGYATDYSNEYQAASINVTICLPPPEPTLIDESNTHDTSLKLEWSSSEDKKGYKTYDEFRLDSGEIIRYDNSGAKEKDISGLDYSLHVWKVRTCNEKNRKTLCCSSWVSDSFNVGNLRPYPPNLTDQLDKVPGEVNFEWISGIDPDGDDTYDEFCYGIINENAECVENVVSPQTKEVFGCNYYEWTVRTCEKESQHLCSQWSKDGFIACELKCPECLSISSINGKVIEETSNVSEKYTLVILSPQSIEEEEPIYLKIKFKSLNYVKNVLFKVSSPNFVFNNFIIPELNNAEATFKITGKPKNITAGIYNLTLNVYMNNKEEFSEKFSITVKKPLLIKISKIEIEIPKKKNWFWILLIIFVISAVYFFIRYKSDRKNKNSRKFLG